LKDSIVIDITGLSKAAVLLALWQASKKELSFLKERKIDLFDCEERLAKDSYVDYFAGEVIKVNFSGNEFNPVLFDRDVGDGAAQKAVDKLRNELLGVEVVDAIIDELQRLQILFDNDPDDLGGITAELNHTSGKKDIVVVELCDDYGGALYDGEKVLEYLRTVKAEDLCIQNLWQKIDDFRLTL
jgi:hypothetical protein